MSQAHQRFLGSPEASRAKPEEEQCLHHDDDSEEARLSAEVYLGVGTFGCLGETWRPNANSSSLVWSPDSKTHLHTHTHICLRGCCHRTGITLPRNRAVHLRKEVHAASLVQILHTTFTFERNAALPRDSDIGLAARSLRSDAISSIGMASAQDSTRRRSRKRT